MSVIIQSYYLSVCLCLSPVKFVVIRYVAAPGGSGGLSYRVRYRYTFLVHLVIAPTVCNEFLRYKTFPQYWYLQTSENIPFHIVYQYLPVATAGASDSVSLLTFLALRLSYNTFLTMPNDSKNYTYSKYFKKYNKIVKYKKIYNII